MSWLRTIFQAINIINYITEWYKKMQMRQQARKEVAEAVRRKEERTRAKTIEIVNAERSDDDNAKRMHDGSF